MYYQHNDISMNSAERFTSRSYGVLRHGMWNPIRWILLVRHNIILMVHILFPVEQIVHSTSKSINHMLFIRISSSFSSVNYNVTSLPCPPFFRTDICWPPFLWDVVKSQYHCVNIVYQLHLGVSRVIYRLLTVLEDCSLSLIWWIKITESLTKLFENRKYHEIVEEQ